MSLISDNNLDRQPFLLAPVGKDYLWGGSRLNDDYAKEIDIYPLAETWECSTHPDGISMVVSGRFAGLGLMEVLKQHPEFLGTHPKMAGGLPILVKLIDAKKDLSVQVHPSDEYASRHEGGQLGKMEMWYVLDAAESGSIVYGFAHDMDKGVLHKSVYDGTVERFLQRVPVKKNDVFFIEPGMVHAIGEGVLIAEIQESSNLTYRLYDYNRTDKNGHKRKLHIDKALDVANLKKMTEPVQPMRIIKHYRGYATDMLCRCKYFQVERMLLNTESTKEMADFKADSTSFQVLLCTDGCGVFFWGHEGMLRFYKGDCIFVPADSTRFKIHGQAQMLKVNC